MSLSPIDYKAKVSAGDFLDKFNDTVIDVPAEDMYYLLQTFASMAMARPWSDTDFVYCVTMDLFKVRPPHYGLSQPHFNAAIVSDRFPQRHQQGKLL